MLRCYGWRSAWSRMNMFNTICPLLLLSLSLSIYIYIYICTSRSHHWFRYLGIVLSPSHYPKQGSHFVDWSPKDEFRSNLHQNISIFVAEINLKCGCEITTIFPYKHFFNTYEKHFSNRKHSLLRTPMTNKFKDTFWVNPSLRSLQ